jgi:hypothetical protein
MMMAGKNKKNHQRILHQQLHWKLPPHNRQMIITFNKNMVSKLCKILVIQRLKDRTKMFKTDKV